MSDVGLKELLRDEALEPKGEDFPRLEDVISMGVGRRRRARLALSSIAASFVLLFVVVGVSVMDRPMPQGSLSQATPGVHPSQQHQVVPGAVGYGNGTTWAPMSGPFGREATLSTARSEAGYPLYTPNTSLASDTDITHVWLGTEAAGGQYMLPDHPQTSVAITYSSGIQVIFTPWVYGVDAPPFSQARNERSYEIAATQDDYISVAEIDSIPVRIESSTSGPAPSSVEFNLGTRNADALTVVVIGRADIDALSDVSSSIIQAWLAVNPS